MEQERQSWKQARHTAGLVPTMGYLHAGHLALVERARRENEILVTSIFVNPLQFGPHEDFSRYPRSLERDTALLEQAGVDLVFYPDATEMYPAGFEAAIEIGGITNGLEGAVRPGHFRGVATVVAKIFNIVGADHAYFGQKDAQQVAVIQKMVRDLNFPLEVIVCPTVREPDGLALSSRNVYLSPTEREAATVLYRALSAAKQLWDSLPPDQRRASQIQQSMATVVANETLARPDYISVANALTLVEYDSSQLIPLGQKVLLSLAVRFGNTRLIDNFLLI
jgi:pantoate--beta-alanine ligase